MPDFMKIGLKSFREIATIARTNDRTNEPTGALKMTDMKMQDMKLHRKYSVNRDYITLK